MQTLVNIPTDYIQGYEKARAVAPEIADNYVAHTLIGDPLGEEMAADLEEFSPQDQNRLIKAGMDNEGWDAFPDAPDSLRRFFDDASTTPGWVDPSAFIPGIRMFHRNSRTILVAFVAGVLIEGFTTNIAKSFFVTGRVRDQGTRCLTQNNRHMMDIFLPGRLDRQGDGWKLSVRIRAIHARVRLLSSASPEWDHEAWGLPVSSAHLGYAISSFSARLLKHMKTLGAVYTQEEYDGFMAVWRYSGWLMGIPESILFKDAREALRLYDIGLICEPSSELESIVMAHALINSAPIVAGISDSAERHHLAQYVYRLTRGLIGKTLADELEFPRGSSFGVVAKFRLDEWLDQTRRKLRPNYNQTSNLNKFSGLLEPSLFDEEGISYRLPDNVYAEQSSKW